MTTLTTDIFRLSSALHGTLTVNTGTGRFQGARGTINFTAMSTQNIQINPDGTIAGVHEGQAYYALRGTLSFRGN
jgi:hypothetical protein